MTNRLSSATSPYLLQHAENPVDWYPWGEEALARARAENKPIFLSIGYAACHWCHVMAHESFEDPRVADFLRQHFVSIKVDREERPDIDQIYMNAVVALTGQGGWPLSVFLTPDGRPFYGGTYFPPTPRYGMPSFLQLLDGIRSAWVERGEQVEQAAQQITASLRETSAAAAGQAGTVRPETLARVLDGLLRQYDWQAGGWGAAPKFPQPMLVQFLLRQVGRGFEQARKAALHALDAMARGGMYDVVGGGFHRYSTDSRWLVPHFEKMLYDNAQLALAYLDAFQLTGEPRYRRVVEETLAFLLREMRQPEGGFSSSLDADSEGHEGKFYVWSLAELRAVLPEDGFALLSAAYALPAQGNFEGQIVLQRTNSDAELAQQLGLDPAKLYARLDDLHARLLEARAARVRPGTDDKVLAGWNALAIWAFARAYRAMGDPRYRQAARDAATFILREMMVDGRLRRSWRAGQAGQPGFLEDLAGMAVALYHLYQADPDPRWVQAANDLLDEVELRFSDPDGGYFDTPADQADLILRPKDVQDNATPCGNSLAALGGLMRRSLDEGEGLGGDPALLVSLQGMFEQYPTAFGMWLNALDWAAGPVLQIAVVGDPASPNTQALSGAVNRRFLPRSVLAQAALPLPAGAPALLHNRPLRDGLPTAYVCQGFVCRQPVNTIEELDDELRALG